jgi:hypothetical protein
MLLRFAKIAGGLRLLITEAAPIVATSVSLLSLRNAAYLVGFGLGSIASIWLPIIATLISITGFFNAGSNTPECEAYRAQMRAIDAANRAAYAGWQVVNKAFIDGPYQNYLSQARDLSIFASNSAQASCASLPESEERLGCDPYTHNNKGCSYYLAFPRSDCEGRERQKILATLQPPSFPPMPAMQTYPACSAPNCPPGKKVWTQVIWGSPSGNFSDTKGCFVVAYSQDAPTLPPKIEYNPFLPKLYVESRALSYYLVNGDRYRGLQDNEWKNLESVQGWDKGYWRSEVTDSECRGWPPGWSRKIK